MLSPASPGNGTHVCTDASAHVAVVLTLPRIIKSVVTGQAPVTLELRNTPGKTHTQPKVVHAYITADAHIPGRPAIPPVQGGGSVVRLILGRILVNLSSTIKQINTL